MARSRYGGGFRYRSKYSIEGGLIWFEFYRTNWWLAMTGDMAQVPELISADGSGVIWFRRLSAAMDANEIGWLFG
jgi:hypothetical protein